MSNQDTSSVSIDREASQAEEPGVSGSENEEVEQPQALIDLTKIDLGTGHPLSRRMIRNCQDPLTVSPRND